MRTILALSLLFAGCPDVAVIELAAPGVASVVRSTVVKTYAGDTDSGRDSNAETQRQCADPHHDQWRHCQLVKNGNCYACCRYCGGCWTEADGSERCSP